MTQYQRELQRARESVSTGSKNELADLDAAVEIAGSSVSGNSVDQLSNT